MKPSSASQATLDKLAHLHDLLNQAGDGIWTCPHCGAILNEEDECSLGCQYPKEKVMDKTTQEEGELLRRSVMTHEEQFHEKMARYKELLANGAITMETFKRLAREAGAPVQIDNHSLGTMKITKHTSWFSKRVTWRVKRYVGMLGWWWVHECTTQKEAQDWIDEMQFAYPGDKRFSRFEERPDYY